MFDCCKPDDYNKYVVASFNKITHEDRRTYGLNKAKKSELQKDLNDFDILKRSFANNKPFEDSPLEASNEPLSCLGQNNCVKKKVMKSNYDPLIAQYQNKSEKWTDPDFPPKQCSYGSSRKNVSWRRASEAIQGPKFVGDGILPSDILQGVVGNCYFLSAIAGIAECDYRIKNIFPNLDIQPNGIYMARILHNGVFMEVVVDDYFPCNSNGNWIGANPSGGKEIWVMVLEKCWAKLYGSYDAIDGGLPNEVLHAISGAPTFTYRLNNGKSQDCTWEKMMTADEKGYVICCGSMGGKMVQELESFGIVPGHAYTIISVYDRPYRMVKIRNPWGNMEWKGRANDKDEKFWETIPLDEQLNMGYQVGDDGIFFMLWQDFLQFFILVDICEINDSANYFYIEENFQPKQSKCFELTLGDGNYYITTSQKSKRQLTYSKQTDRNGKKLKLANAVMVLGKQSQCRQHYQYIKSEADYSKSDCYLYVCDVKAGNYNLCVFFENMDEMAGTVSIYSTSAMSFKEVDLNVEDFLHGTFLDHAKKNRDSQQFLSQAPEQWACLDILTTESGIGYSAFHMDPNSPRKLGLEFDQNQYDFNCMQLMAPYKDSGNFKLVCEPGKEIIVLCKMKTGNYSADFMMPTPRIYKLK